MIALMPSHHVIHCKVCVTETGPLNGLNFIQLRCRVVSVSILLYVFLNNLSHKRTSTCYITIMNNLNCNFVSLIALSLIKIYIKVNMEKNVNLQP